MSGRSHNVGVKYIPRMSDLNEFLYINSMINYIFEETILVECLKN